MKLGLKKVVYLSVDSKGLVLSKKNHGKALDHGKEFTLYGDGLLAICIQIRDRSFERVFYFRIIFHLYAIETSTYQKEKLVKYKNNKDDSKVRCKMTGTFPINANVEHYEKALNIFVGTLTSQHYHLAALLNSPQYYYY